MTKITWMFILRKYFEDKGYTKTVDCLFLILSIRVRTMHVLFSVPYRKYIKTYTLIAKFFMRWCEIMSVYKQCVCLWLSAWLGDEEHAAVERLSQRTSALTGLTLDTVETFQVSNRICCTTTVCGAIPILVTLLISMSIPLCDWEGQWCNC